VQASTSWSHQPQVLLVLAATTRDGRDWVKVRLGDRPNTAAGWIPGDHVRLDHTSYWVEVRRGARRVTIFRKGKRIRSFRAVIGKPSTPTPLGLAAIYESNRQPNPRDFLGPWALSLTALSNVLESYGGGPGRVASTAAPARARATPSAAPAPTAASASATTTCRGWPRTYRRARRSACGAERRGPKQRLQIASMTQA
jgi:L,D-transpeptidase catalytic domain